jgi:hypothetical protein
MNALRNNIVSPITGVVLTTTFICALACAITECRSANTSACKKLLKVIFFNVIISYFTRLIPIKHVDECLRIVFERLCRTAIDAV